MAILVSASVDRIGGTFPQATGWVVDDNGYLHVTVKDKGNCATFHPSAWLSVERDEDAK